MVKQSKTNQKEKKKKHDLKKLWCMNPFMNSTTSGRPLWQISILCDFSFIHFPYTCLIKWRPWLNQECASKKPHWLKRVRIPRYSGPHFSRIFPHSDWIRKDTNVLSPNVEKYGRNADQNSSEYGHFLRSSL